MSSKKKGGSAKKSKKVDAERLLLEEEERKRKQEEEARLAEIRAKKERELKEQKEKEALEQLFQQNKDRLDQEAQKTKDILEEHSNSIQEAAAKAKSDSEWSKFLGCNSLPDPTDEKGVNTYLSMWRDENLGADDESSLQNLLTALPQAEKLCDDLLQAMAVRSDEQKEAELQHLKAHLLELRMIIQVKWDVVTTRVLQHIDHFHVEPNENFQYSHGIPRYSFGVWGNLTKNPRHKAIEFNDINMTMTLPKPIALANVSIRMLYETSMSASLPFQEQEGPVHLTPVGGMLFFDLFEMPDPPKTFDKWIIRQILSPAGKLKPIAYPFKKTVTEQADDEEEGAADTNIWPTLVTYEIPPSAFIHRDSAKVMAWQESERMWVEENIGDVEINLELGQVKFRTTQFAPTALVQKTYSEYPIQHWELKYVQQNLATLIIHGSSNEIEIEIAEGKCRLKKPQSKCLEALLQDEWMSPSLLLWNLWKNVIYDCNYKVADKGVQIAFLSQDAEVTDETKFDVNNADKNNSP
ncbi:Protein casc1 [Phlyctochytrium bullatum]|nr:Protein casc1 [Phlyctochytrium bullatum]